MATTWGEKRSSLRPVRMSAVACRPWPRTAASMVLVSPCVSVLGLGVLCGVGSVTTLSWPAWAQPSHSHACVVTLVGSSSHAPGQPSPASPASPAQPCRLQTGWTTSLIFMLLLYSPAQAVGTLVLCMCCMCGVTPISDISTYLLWRRHVSRVTLCGRVTRRDQ